MYTSGTVWLWGPVLCLGRIFVGSAPVAGLLFFGTKYYCFRGLRPFGSGSRFWSCTVRDRLPLKEKQGVATTALTSVRNALQKPETVYDLKRLLLTSRPWLLPDFFVDPGGPSQRLYSGHWSELGSTKDKGIPPSFSLFSYFYSFVLCFARISRLHYGQSLRSRALTSNGVTKRKEPLSFVGPTV